MTGQIKRNNCQVQLRTTATLVNRKTVRCLWSLPDRKTYQSLLSQTSGAFVQTIKVLAWCVLANVRSGCIFSQDYGECNSAWYRFNVMIAYKPHLL